jgi:hypothetical protein
MGATQIPGGLPAASGADAAILGGQRATIGLGEKLLRGYGKLQEFADDGNPFAVKGMMGDMKDIWSGYPGGKTSMNPGEHQAMSDNPYKQGLMRSGLSAVFGGGNPIGQYYNDKDNQQQEHRYGVQRDYWKSMLNRMGTE